MLSLNPGMRGVVLAVTAIVGIGCRGELSPAQPSEIFNQPIMTASPGFVMRSGNAMAYYFTFSLTNPPASETVTVRRVEFTVLGANDAEYGTSVSTYTGPMLPGGGVSGGAGPVFDFDLARPLATRYRARTIYVRSDGSTATAEASSTVVPR